MKLGIMQPYAFPYLGYFQLIHHVDKFVLLDDVAFIKQGWINRNMLAGPNGVQRFTFPVTRPHGDQRIKDLKLDQAERHRVKFLKSIDQLYRSAPYHEDVRALIEGTFGGQGEGLADNLAHMTQTICSYLGITTPIVRSSERYTQLEGQGQDRIVAMCLAEGAGTYVNAEGGKELYDEATFRDHDLQLCFLEHVPTPYTHFCEPFRPRLSIIDVMMFNDRSDLSRMLDNCNLVRPSEMN